jgi:SAM-dependent methyltransferase
LIKRTRALLAAPPEPFLETKRSFDRVSALINSMPERSVIFNVGSGATDHGPRVINIDIYDSGTTDVVGSALELPFADESADLIILQGVLEHVPDTRKTLDECIRVMRKGGKFYTEMPFMQPYHESPVDFRRCTLMGLSDMCRPLKHIESGIHMGPASNITWQLREFGAILLSRGNEWWYPRINSIVGWFLFPLKYADHWLEKRPEFHRLASSFYYLGVKSQD